MPTTPDAADRGDMSMRDRVFEKVEALRRHHEGLKDRKHGYLVRPLTLLLGWLIVIVGLITIPFPGPGWFTVFIGFGVLSLELHWSHRLLTWAVQQYDKLEGWYKSASTPVRAAMAAATLVLIWIVFALIAYIMWRFELAGWAMPLLDRLASWTGLHK
ncbi:TIGR02611 family protein [Corynebacterium heidelbergense]|nr:TIGR02611 family protein [Corynebacterium heidelbergense]WCZ35708.1 Putative transmembrane protein (PGPGW) [Corynebacterium heidelbergense]